MENLELYTPCGLWHIVTSVKEIVQNNHNISSTVCIIIIPIILPLRGYCLGDVNMFVLSCFDPPFGKAKDY